MKRKSTVGLVLVIIILYLCGRWLEFNLFGWNNVMGNNDTKYHKEYNEDVGAFIETEIIPEYESIKYNVKYNRREQVLKVDLIHLDGKCDYCTLSNLDDIDDCICSIEKMIEYYYETLSLVVITYEAPELDIKEVYAFEPSEDVRMGKYQLSEKKGTVVMDE